MPMHQTLYYSMIGLGHKAGLAHLSRLPTMSWQCITPAGCSNLRSERCCIQLQSLRRMHMLLQQVQVLRARTVAAPSATAAAGGRRCRCCSLLWLFLLLQPRR